MSSERTGSGLTNHSSSDDDGRMRKKRKILDYDSGNEGDSPRPETDFHSNSSYASVEKSASQVNFDCDRTSEIESTEMEFNDSVETRPADYYNYDAFDLGYEGMGDFLMSCELENTFGDYPSYVVGPETIRADSVIGDSTPRGNTNYAAEFEITAEDKDSKSICRICNEVKTFTPCLVCHMCHKSLGKDEKYLTYQGWLICDSNCFSNCVGTVHLVNDFEEANTNNPREEDVDKSMFESKLNNVAESEPLVTCACCSNSFHNICVNQPNSAFSSPYPDGKFICEDCMKSRLKLLSGIYLSRVLSPESITKTDLSIFMEKRVNNIFPDVPKVLVRVLCSVPKTHVIQGNLRTFLGEQPVEFPYVAKTICCFQSNFTKKDHMIFTLCVQEYGDDCPSPNRNTIYFSMLDSLRLVAPPKRRTSIFQATILSYLDYMRMSGFKSVFLWSCPPRGPGFDYIFIRKPNNQRIITAPFLNNWYQCLLKIGKKVSILKKYCTLFDWVKSQKINNASDFRKKFPYFEDDYWTDENAELYELLSDKKPKAGLFKSIKALLRAYKDSFYVMTLNDTCQQFQNNFSSRNVMPSVVADDRNALVRFFRSNNLEFEDVRKATNSTLAFVLEIGFEHNVSKESTSGISEGIATTMDVNITLPVKIPNLFKEEYMWKCFKDDILNSLKDDDDSRSTAPISIENPFAVMELALLIRHCSGCTKDSCKDCVIVKDLLTGTGEIPERFLHAVCGRDTQINRQDVRRLVIDSFNNSTSFSCIDNCYRDRLSVLLKKMRTLQILP